MKVYPCDTEVTMKAAGMKATITAVTIRFSAVLYECSYFYNGEFKNAWLNEAEFTTDGKKTTIGFKKDA